MIGAKRVTAPDGTTWQVGRRWLPDKPTLWRRQDRDNEGDDPTGGGDWVPDLGFDEAFAFVLVILAAVLVIALLTTLVFPIVVLTLELLIVLVLLLAGLAGRFLLRKPWTIRAIALPCGRPPGWRNWSTRWTQNPLPARACGFESRPGHAARSGNP